MIDERITRLSSAAARMHAGQSDKQGQPYIEHVRAVTRMVSDRAKPAALFHDAIEDGVATRDTLAAMLTSDELEAVEILTRSPDEPYARYIAGVATAGGLPGAIAREVKVADVRHNVGRLTPELERLRRRYQSALVVLQVADEILRDHGDAPHPKPASFGGPVTPARRVYHGPRVNLGTN